MIKKRVLAILTVLLMLILAGCIKATTSVTVNTDGSGSVRVIMAMLKTYAEQGGLEQAFGTVNEQYKNQGYTVENYSDDKYTGYAYVKSFSNIKDVAAADVSGMDIAISDTDPKVLTINSNIDANSQLASQGYDASQLSSYGDFEMTFELNLPNAATSNNATQELNNGTTLKWDLTKTQNIQVEATLSGGGGAANWLLIGVIVGGILLIAIIVLLIVLSGRKKRAAAGPEQYVQQYQPPVQPVEAAPTPVAEPAQEPAPEKPAMDSDVERHIRETVDKFK